MPELSNVLRQRLASVEEPQVHPDADTLAAYMEQLLAAPERKQVLEHLAACGQCREVTFYLSAPQAPEADAVTTIMPVRRRSWRSAWGLAASVAGLALVTAVIVELPRQAAQFQKQAGPATPAASPSGNAPAVVANDGVANDGVANDRAASEPNAGLTSSPNAAHENASIGRPQDSLRAAETAKPRRDRAAAPDNGPSANVNGPYVNVEMFANDTNNVAPYIPDLPAAPPPQLSNGPQNGFLSNRGQNGFQLSYSAPLSASPAPYEIQGSKPLRILTPSPSTMHIFGFSTLATLGSSAKTTANRLIRRPVPSINVNTFASSAMGGAGQLNPTQEPGLSEEAASRAMDKESGDLARSHAFTSRAMASDSAGKAEAGYDEAGARKAAGFQPAWKINDNKLLKLNESGAWTQAYPAADSIEFSVVTSHGTDVWAGGGNAALVHSRDGGASWERITLGSSATGAINGIEASGMRVVVRSSSGQSWSSADGGRTWVLQD